MASMLRRSFFNVPVQLCLKNYILIFMCLLDMFVHDGLQLNNLYNVHLLYTYKYGYNITNVDPGPGLVDS